MNNKTVKILAALTLTAMCVFPGAAQAQAAYPGKPIRLVVPFPPGGATDSLARIVGEQLADALGQQVVVENKPGGGTIIGAEAVSKAPADGHTLLMATSTTLAINPSLYRKLPYDPVKDFVPLAMVASVPFVLVVNASMPARNLAELASLVQAKPSAYASAGNGTMHHLAGEMFKNVARLDLAHVPYKGGAPAVADVIGGQVPMMFADLAPALPHIASGRLRALAVTTTRRLDILPNVPTVAESGYPGFEAVAWQSLVAPANTPKEIVTKLSAEISRILAQPAVRQRIAQQGLVPGTMPADQLEAYFATEIVRWRKIVQASGAVAD